MLTEVACGRLPVFSTGTQTEVSDMEVPADPHPGSSSLGRTLPMPEVTPLTSQGCPSADLFLHLQVTHGTIPGALFSWHTSLYNALISS